MPEIINYTKCKKLKKGRNIYLGYTTVVSIAGGVRIGHGPRTGREGALYLKARTVNNFQAH